MNDMSVPRHQILRMRRDVRRRSVVVAGMQQITPGMRRIWFESPELHDFESLGFDDHIKLFVPAPGAPGGGSAVCMRDYTPRAFDTARGMLTIDFALHGEAHDAGPATRWALAARVGDRVDVGGPRGSTLVPDDFDWTLLMGDETALPAMGRMVEAARNGARVVTIGVVDGPAEQQNFTTRAAWSPLWVYRDGGCSDAAAVISALGRLPEGEGYIWIAGEALMARALREHVVGALGHNAAWVKASGYWLAGEAGAHEKIG